MELTYLGYISILLVVVLFVKYIKRPYVLPTLPLFMLVFTYFKFWGYSTKVEISTELNCLILLSFIITIFTYSIGRRIKISKLEILYTQLGGLRLKFNSSDKIISNKSLNAYLVVTILYCIFDLWLNTQLYGSLENALIRFYGKPMIAGVPTFYKTIQLYFYKSLVALIFVYRFFLDKYNRHSKILLLITLLLVLIALPKGSRGAATMPFMFIIAADIFALTYIKKFKWKKNIKEYLLIIYISIILILSLTVIRDFNYTDAKDLYTAIENVKLGEAKDQYYEGEGDLILRDTKFCFEHYGKRQDYIGFTYTLQNLIFAPVPRVLMPSKKVSFGYVLNESKQGGTSLDPIKLNYPNAVGWAAGIVGEGWANGGVIAVIFYSIIFGLYSGICARMYFLLMKDIKPISILFGLLFYQASVSYVRGDILAGFTQGFYPIAFITIIVLLIKWKKQIKNPLKIKRT